MRVTCHEDPETAFPQFFSGGVAITLEDGRTLSRHVRVNSGAGERAMDPQAVADKFVASASLAIGDDQALAIRDAVLNLEQVPVRELMRLLRAQG